MTRAVKESSVERLKKVKKEIIARSLVRTTILPIWSAEGIPVCMFAAEEQRGERTRNSREEWTPYIVIAEFTDKYAREKMNPKEGIKFIRTKSTIFPLETDVAELSAVIK